MFSIFKGKKTEKNGERSTRSVVKASKKPAKSGFFEHHAKKFIVMTKKTAGNVKANVTFAVNHKEKERKFAIESRGYNRKGTYAPGSTSLAHAIKRLKKRRLRGHCSHW